MLIAKLSVQRAAVLCWVTLCVVGLGLNDWQLQISSPASFATASLACFGMAGLNLATLVTDRARKALCDPGAEVGKEWLRLAVFCAGFAYGGLCMLLWALVTL